MIDYQLDDLGIATLTWDMPGRSQNVINGGSCAALFAAIEKAATDSAVKGILMTSAKPDFVAGGDLEWLLSADGAEFDLAAGKVSMTSVKASVPVGSALKK